MKIYKKDIDGAKVRIEGIFIEDNEFYIFKAKEEIFNVKNIILFLKNQFELMNVEEKEVVL